MQKLVVLAILSLLVITGCQTIEPEELPRNDYKVHAYYVIPNDMSYSQDHVNRTIRSFFEMQRWYQTATGGITFEILDEENIIEIYYTDKASTFYAEDWWNLLLKEMKDKGMPIQSPGTIALLWIEGIVEISETAVAQGGQGCDGECGVAIMPVHTIVAQTSPPADMGLTFHEMGHTLGLFHPVEESELPIPAADQPLLSSVMNQGTVRVGNSNAEHGFLTYEKAKLNDSPFLKSGLVFYQDFWESMIINYPVTGTVPEPQIEFQLLNSRSVSFSTNISNALHYYWYFGDGTTSNEASPTHQFNSSNWYTVTLMVTEKNQMANRVSKFVQIQ
jgi:hypothetical protein